MHTINLMRWYGKYRNQHAASGDTESYNKDGIFAIYERVRLLMLRVDEIRENVEKWYPPVKELATLKPKKKAHPDEA